MTLDSTKRFSNRVRNYSLYRPTYPTKVIDILNEEIKFDTKKKVADIGSGTGILTKIFLDNRNFVYAVEPNHEMRSEAEKNLINYSNFHSVDGTAEKTNLASKEVDFITVGQAFHWFKHDITKLEFQRILKPSSYACLIWNSRAHKLSSFNYDYEEFIKKYSNDYNEVTHENIYDEIFNSFFDLEGYKKFELDNQQILDFKGLKGRTFSSSYMPNEDSEEAENILEELKGLFEKYQEKNCVIMKYITEIFLGRLT
ncbi:MAG: class I SAM-dependent methyltransferase [Candidatus Thorarchaeota archaeon]